MARGQLGDALTHYHAAVGMCSIIRQLKNDFFPNAINLIHDFALVFVSGVEGDPNNYLTYFKRGTVYLALGKARFALTDLSKVLELKPDFTAARIQRGTVHLKLGDYNSAEIDLHDVVSMLNKCSIHILSKKRMMGMTFERCSSLGLFEKFGRMVPKQLNEDFQIYRI